MTLHVVQVVCSTAFAGVERYVLSAACAQAARGIRVTVVGGDPAVFPSALREHGASWLPAATTAAAARALRGIADADVVNSHMTEADVAAGLSASRRTALVSTRHFAARRGGNALNRAVARAAVRRLGAQIAISHYVAEHVEGDSIVIHTGIEDRDRPPRPRDPVVLVAQRLEAEKRTQDALLAWRRTAAARSGWRLAIAGDGSERARLERLAHELGVAESVDFLGFVRDMPALYDSASLLVAPTPREGLGLSVVEAMAHGLPVVASDAGGHRETVGGVADAALFPPEDAAALAMQIDVLAADDARRAAYGEALRARQRSRFTVARQTDLTVAVYEGLR